MGRKIVDETLKFEILINGDAAKKEYGQLERATKKLLDANGDLEAQAKKLEKANKTQTDAYKKLKSEIEQNAKTIQQNEAKMSGLTKEIGINNLGMRQLGKEARKLTALMSGLDPETDQWKKYSKELQSITGRQANLRQQMRATSASIKEQTTLTQRISSAFKTLIFPISGALLFVDALKAGARYVKEFIVDAVKLSIEAKGIEFAFKRLGEEGQTAFNNVKASTKGLLSNLDIKKAVVEFDNFNISQKEAGTLFEFLSVRAAQTGKSIEYLRDSLVEGLSKESKLRIDNLGISASELNKELEKTPDFVQAVANIAKREVAEAGNILDEAASSSQKWNATLENSKLVLGNIIRNSGAVSFFQDFASATLEAITPTKSLVGEIQNEQVELNLLVNRITDVNVSNEERDRLMSELNEKYPAFLQFLGNEKTDNESLGIALKEINELYIKRIALQSQQEVIEKLLNKAGKEAFIATKRQISVGRELANINTKELKGSLDLTNKSYEEQLRLVREKLAEDAKYTSGTGTSLKLAINDEAKALDRLNSLVENTNSSKYSQKKVNNELAEQQLLMKQIEENLGKTISDINKIFDANTAGKNANKVATRELSEEEKKAAEELLKLKLRNREELEAAIMKFEEEQAIRDQVAKVDKDQKKEEEELIRKELEFQKLIEKAGEETDLVKSLEELKLIELQFIRDKYAKIYAEKDKENKIKLVERTRNAYKKLAEAEQFLIDSKRAAANTGLSIARSFFGESSAIGKAIFALQKAFAVSEILINSKKAVGQIIASTAIANAHAVAASPLTFGQPFVGINTSAALANIAATKTAALVSVGGIIAETIKGFEKGLYPLTRHDGKTFNASFGGAPTTQVVNSPKHFIAGEVKPEMIIDGDTFKRMDPAIIDYIKALAGKPVQGYEGGMQTPTYNNSLDISLFTGAVTMLIERLDQPMTAEMYFGMDAERRRKQVEDQLKSVRNNAKLRKDAN